MSFEVLVTMLQRVCTHCKMRQWSAWPRFIAISAEETTDTNKDTQHPRPFFLLTMTFLLTKLQTAHMSGPLSALGMFFTFVFEVVFEPRSWHIFMHHHKIVSKWFSCVAEETHPHICTVFVCINASHVISTLDDAKDGQQRGAVLMLGGLCGQKCKLSGKCH